MFNISIPKPCHQDWHSLIPNEQGRHCNTCVKTVVDFTSMTDEQVKDFFISRQRESICGRFKNEQLQRICISLPHNIYQITMPLWKQFLTALLLAFSSMLFSCDSSIGKTQTVGEPLVEIPLTTNSNGTAGMVKMIDTTLHTASSSIKGDTLVMVEGITQGVTSIDPVEPMQQMVELAAEPGTVQPDTSEKYFTGKMVLERTGTTAPLAIDTAKKNPPVADSADCNNSKYY